MMFDISWLSIYDTDNAELLIFFKSALRIENDLLVYKPLQILFTCSTITKFSDT